MNLYLIRHGVTDLNLKKIIQGNLKSSLNEIGKIQICNLFEILETIRNFKIFSSPVVRAAESAELIANFLNSDFTVMPEFSEFKVDEWKGKSLAELNRSSKSWAKYKRDPIKMVPNSGETISDLSLRVSRGLNRIKKKKATNSIVVTHAEVIRIIICNVMKIPLSDLDKFIISPGSLSIIRDFTGKPKIELLNYIANKPYPK